MKVFELQKIPEPVIIMACYSHRNIIDAGIVDDDRYASALGQILDGLGHLHTKGVVPRDLKPANFLIEKDPFFKVIIIDFGLAKVTADTVLLINALYSA